VPGAENHAARDALAMCHPTTMKHVVHRPDPPRDEPKPKLSREEVQALLAVTKTQGGAWGRTARRGGLALVPTALLSTLLDVFLGWWSIPVVIALAILWTAQPLVRQARDGWT